jgi:hypothetical protein
MWLGAAARARHAGSRVIGEVHRFLCHRREIIEDAFNMGQPLDDLAGNCHGLILPVKELSSIGPPLTE